MVHYAMPSFQKKAAVLHWGDHTDINSWSGVHYHMGRAFDEHCETAVHVDMRPACWVEWVYNRLFIRAVRVFLRPFNITLCCTFMHTFWARRRVERLMRSVAVRHPDLDLVVMTCLFFDAHRFFACPVVLYSDQTVLQLIHNTLQRKPNRIERRLIVRESACLSAADLVLLSDEKAVQFTKDHYPGQQRKVMRIPGGIKVSKPKIDVDEIISLKKQNSFFLFIGRGYHKRGVDILLEAFRLFRERGHGDYRLALVGIKPRDLPPGMENVKAYAFLDKAKTDQWAVLEELMTTARLFVMPSRYGPGAGAVAECMLYATPALGSPSTSIRIEDGKTGWIETSLEPAVWTRRMEEAVSSEDYGHICRRAQEATLNQTWDGFPARLEEALKQAEREKDAGK